ncbi:hypothetical protein [Psychrobacillus sp. L4]|uniref:hypothetical protein n=1 Tax=Psychrobacillus sp. L4 TaxID=3236892 RepID=UPI0036F418EC
MNKERLKKSVVAAVIATSLLTSSNVSFANNSIQETIDRAKIDMKNAAYAYVKPAENRRIVSSEELYRVLNLAKENYQNARSLVIKSELSNKEAVLKELDTLYNERLTKGLIPYIDAFNYVDKYLNPIMAEIKQAESEQDWPALEQAYHKLSVQLNTRTDILYRFTGKVSRDLLLEQYKKPANLKRDQLIVPVTIYMKVKEAETLMALGKKEEASKTLETIIPLLENLPTAKVFPMIVELIKEIEIVSKAAGLVIFPPAPHPSPITSGSSKKDKNNTNADERAAANKAAARAVIALINALPIPSNVRVSDGVAIEAARAAYDKLTTVQKAMVDNTVITRLKEAEKAFKAGVVNEQAAKVVINLIESLPAAVDVTVEDEEQIKEARTSYEGLTDVQKAMVDITSLITAEKALEEAKISTAVKDKAKAQEVIILIEGIQKSNTAIKYKQALEAAKTAYESLTETQQALVTNFEKLKNELADFAAVETEASKLTAEAIGVLVEGDNLVKRAKALLEDGYTVTILTSQAGMLNGKLIVQPKAGEKANIGTVEFQVKSANGTKIERSVVLTVEPKDDSNKLAVEAVKSLIAALPKAKEVTLKHEIQIQAARAAYEGLTDVQKALVKITALTNAEKALEVVKTKAAKQDKAKAQEVIKLIEAIKKNNSKYKEALEAAKTAYESLTETQQALVTNFEKLKNELADFAAVEAEASKLTAEAIGVLVEGDNLLKRATALLEDGYTVTILTSPAGMLNGKLIVQPKVGEKANIGTVEFQVKSANGTKIDRSVVLIVEPKDDSSKLAVDAVKSLIAALPTAKEVTLKHEIQIQVARAAYEGLTDVQKALVKITALTNAEKALEEAKIKAAAEDKKKAQEVIKLIEGIQKSNNAVKYKEALEAAKTAYESLTETQQALVTNFEKLKNELADFAVVEAEASKLTAEAIGVLVEGDNLLKRATALLEDGYTVTILTSPAGMLNGKLIVQPKAGEKAIIGTVVFLVKSANGMKIEHSVVLIVEPKEGK